MDTIDRVVYINLTSRTDRRAHIEEELKRWGLHATRFEAVRATPGWIGCTQSHCEVVRQAMHDGVKNLMVIEDDACLRGTWSSVDAILRSAPAYDVLMLDYNLQKGSPPVGYWGRVFEASVATMYVVAGHYLPVLYQNLKEAVDGALRHPTVHWVFINDQYWKRLQPSGRWYYASPRLAHQMDGYSDLGQTYTEHTYHKEPIVSVLLQGGLANLLWEVAAADYVAETLGRTVGFSETRTPATQHSSKNYFETVLKAWAHTVASPTYVVCKERSYAMVEKEAWKEALGQVPADTSILLDGYFQNYRYIRSEFVERLVLPPPVPVAPTAAFVHIRGGDYVRHWLHDVGLNDGSYYPRAMALFPPDTHFYLFTNDPTYASTVPWIKDLPAHTWMHGLDEEQTLATMAACPRGGICANSTFSWWAAYLQKMRGGQGTWVLPSKWFNDPSVYIDGYMFPGSLKVVT